MSQVHFLPFPKPSKLLLIFVLQSFTPVMQILLVVEGSLSFYIYIWNNIYNIELNCSLLIYLFFSIWH